MRSARSLATFLALCGLSSMALHAPPAHAGSGNPPCLILSSQSGTQLYISSNDATICDTLAAALSQNGLQFSTAAPGSVATPPFAALACGLSFAQGDETVGVDIFGGEGGDEASALCQTFRRAGFSLAPDVHWGMICGVAGAANTQAGAIAQLITCGPSGFPTVSP